MMRFGKWALGAVACLFMLWVFSERILFQMSWRAMTEDGLQSLPKMQQDLASGQTGMLRKDLPCMKTEIGVDMSIEFTGFMPSGDNIAMFVSVNSSEAMVSQIYFGPPVRTLSLKHLPLCVAGPEPLTDKDEAAWTYLRVSYYDLDGKRYQSFGSEDAEPIFAWQNVTVELLEFPQTSRSQGVTTLLARKVE